MADKRKSILVDSLDYCYECGKPHPHKHEVFFGKNRDDSIKYNMILPLCYEQHEGNRGPHLCRNTDLAYKRLAQDVFEHTYGSREDFISIFGKSYL